MNKSLLLSGVIVTTLAASFIAANSFAASGANTTSGENTRLGVFGMKMGGPGGHSMIENLTDAEKTALESMTDAEKKAFFETKRAEAEAKRDARETVIDKLLAGTSLTTDEETIRKEIITERAERKAKQAEMKANMEKIKAIMDKKKAGTTLTTEEQALLDNMPKMDGKGGKNRQMHREE